MHHPGYRLPRISLPGTWVNRRYDARSLDDPGYTDTVREYFDRIADLRGGRVGPEGGHGAPSSEVPLNTSRTTPSKVALRCEVRDPGAAELTAEDHVVLTLGPRNGLVEVRGGDGDVMYALTFLSKETGI